LDMPENTRHLFILPEGEEEESAAA
jgi:hypothetical protein